MRGAEGVEIMIFFEAARVTVAEATLLAAQQKQSKVAGEGQKSILKNTKIDDKENTTS